MSPSPDADASSRFAIRMPPMPEPPRRAADANGPSSFADAGGPLAICHSHGAGVAAAGPERSVRATFIGTGVRGVLIAEDG